MTSLVVVVTSDCFFGDFAHRVNPLKCHSNVRIVPENNSLKC